MDPTKTLVSALSDTSFRTGTDLFQALTRHIAALTGCRHVLIARVVSDGEELRARTLAWWTGERFLDEVEYALAGTPCDGVVKRGICFHPSNLQNLFPEDATLRELELHSYIGVPMFGPTGERIGLVAALDTRPLTQQIDTQVLEILTARAAAEFGRLEAERNLLKSREQLELALAATRDGVFDLDLITGRTGGSDQLWEMLGYPREALQTLADWSTIVHPDDLEATRRALVGHLKGHSALYTVEMRLRAKDGSWRWILDRGRVVERDAKGGALRMTGLHTDITARKAMEAQVAASARLASIGTLAAGLAHEINTPLTYLSAGLESLARHLPAVLSSAPPRTAAPLLEALQIAREGAERVGQTVRDIKAFSRPDEDEQVAVDVRTVIAQAIRLARHEIAPRARLVEALGEVPKVRAQPSRLGQVVLNLLLNAAQSIPEGDRDHHEVRISTFVDDAGAAVMEVRDTGGGIDAAVAPHIFDPFFTRRAAGGGTGLGLWICHQIIERLGGRISFESGVGAGTCFRVTLPADASVATGASSTSELKQEGRPGRVLVIDDHANIGLSLRLFLEREHEVRTATNVAAALAELSVNARFDLVLCDLRMPDATGMEMYQRLVERAPDLADRVVFMTGGAFTNEARAFLTSVPNLVLEKPFPPERVCELLRTRARA